MARKQARFGQPAVYNATPPTLSDGDDSALNVNVNGDLRVVLGATGSSATQGLGAYQTVVLQNAATATGNGTSVTLSGMAAGNLEITGTFVGTITFESQSAAGTWSAINLQQLSSSTLATSTTTTGTWRMPVGGFSAFRARISAYTSGSITATVFAANTAYTPSIQNAAIYDKLDPTNDGITTYPFGHSYTNITTNTTTTVKSGAGVLMGIVVNNPAALTVANLTLTIYDNTAGSGTKVGTITVPFGATSSVPFRIGYNLAFSTGLTIVTAGPTAAADITVEWR